MKANELEEYSAKELDRLSREREQAIKAKGGLPYLGSLTVGESRILLMPKLPTDNPDKDGRPRKGWRDHKRGPRKCSVGFPRRLIPGESRCPRTVSLYPENSLSSRSLTTSSSMHGPSIS